MTAMATFIEDYLSDPASAISAARERANSRNWFEGVPEDLIYEEIASSEFHLYEAVIMSDGIESTPRTDGYAVVA